jgi:hypothetical protein
MLVLFMCCISLARVDFVFFFSGSLLVMSSVVELKGFYMTWESFGREECLVSGDWAVES